MRQNAKIFSWEDKNTNKINKQIRKLIQVKKNKLIKVLGIT